MPPRIGRPRGRGRGGSGLRIETSIHLDMEGEAALFAQADGFLDLLAGGLGGWALVKAHGDVGAEGVLHVDGLARAEEDLCAVEVRLEEHALVGQLAPLGETEYLKAAAVGENGTVPVHELGESAASAHDFGTGAEVEMVHVAEEDAGLDDFAEIPGKDALDRALRAHRHEDGSGDFSPREAKEARPGVGGGIRFLDEEGSVSGC